MEGALIHPAEFGLIGHGRTNDNGSCKDANKLGQAIHRIDYRPVEDPGEMIKRTGR